MKKKLKYFISALTAGFFNGAFGSGAGTFVILILKKLDLPQKKAHATSVLIVFMLSIFTFLSYFFVYDFNISASFVFIPFGIFGSFIGSFLLKKVKTSLLRRIFGIILVIFSLRLFFQ